MRIWNYATSSQFDDDFDPRNRSLCVFLTINLSVLLKIGRGSNPQQNNVSKSEEINFKRRALVDM